MWDPARSANRRQVQGRWAAAADRVLPGFGRRAADARDRRILRRGLQDLFGAERPRRPRCGDGEPSPAEREWRTRARSASSNPLPASKATVATERHPEVVATIGAWAASKGYDAAIWNALASNFDDWGKGGEPFSVSAALQYLETLERDDPAKFAAGARLHSQSAARGRDAGARATSPGAGPGDGTAQHASFASCEGLSFRDPDLAHHFVDALSAREKDRIVARRVGAIAADGESGIDGKTFLRREPALRRAGRAPPERPRGRNARAWKFRLISIERRNCATASSSLPRKTLQRPR